jgi:hypothetical protein
MNLVTSKAGAKHKLLFNKPACYSEKENQSLQPQILFTKNTKKSSFWELDDRSDLTRDQARNRTKCQMEKKSHKNISIVEIFN